MDLQQQPRNQVQEQEEEQEQQQQEGHSADAALDARVRAAQAAFYTQHAKRQFFAKNTQKFQCAEHVLSSCSFEDLMRQTCHTLTPRADGTPRLHFYYPRFKTFASTSIYGRDIDYVIAFVQATLATSPTGHFEYHVSLESFTVTAAHRYKDLVAQFSDVCFQRNTGFSEHLDGLYLYHVPSCGQQVAQLLLPLIPPETRPKLKVLDKQQSQPLYPLLFSEIN